MSPEEGERKDFMDFQREHAGDIDRADMMARRRESIQIVTFTKNRDLGRMDPVGRHPANGFVVFPDKRRLGGGIKPGETYFCELQEHVPPGTNPIYYANPITRIDPGFLFDLRADQVVSMIDALGRSALGQLTDQVRAQVRAQLEAATRAELDSLREQATSARAEADLLKAELGRQQEENGTLRLESEGLAQRIKELEEVAREEREASPPTAAAIAVAPGGGGWQALGVPEVAVHAVRRTDADRLESAFFADGRHFVHVSPDRRMLMVHPHGEGNLPAVGRRLVVPGLGVLRPYDGPEELPARVDIRTGGLLVDISVERERSSTIEEWYQ
jgi:hypothetical protein